MPADYALTVLIDNVDVTDYTPYEEMDFDDHIHDVSTFKLVLQAPSGVTPARNMVLEVIAKTMAGTPTIFYGYIVAMTTRKRDNGISLEYEIEAADRKIRLQKSVLAPKEYTGSDLDILQNLLADAYPDLSSEFDFSSLTNSLADNLDFKIDDMSLADALSKLSDMTGAKYSFDEQGSGSQIITFDPDIDTIIYDPTFPYDDPSWHYGIRAGVTPEINATLGNGGGYCMRFYGTTPAASDVLGTIDVRHTSTGVSNIKFDYLLEAGSPVLFFDVNSSGSSPSLNAVADGNWHSVDWLNDVGTPATDASLLDIHSPAGVASFDIRIDNFEIVTEPAFVEGGNSLRWDFDYPATDFDFDIANSDEYGHDFDFTEGSLDDFNSVTVIGGKENVPFDWTYHLSGSENHISLEMPIKGIAVYKNTGSDVSPTWTAQAVGVLGTDELTGAGGSKDVLYAVDNHWLLFNSEPSNLNRSIRVTGTYEKPIRVRVENAASGDIVYATTLYDDSVTTEDEAAAVGLAELNRRNALRQLSFTTYDPGLKVGQAVNVLDSARGLDETIVIRRMVTTWLGASGHAKFEVDCGEDDGASFEAIVANTDKRSRKAAQGEVAVTSSVQTLFDVDGITPLYGVDNALLYEVA